MTTRLTREFRFYWRGAPLPDECANSWGGWSSSLILGIPLALRLTVEGPVGRPSGYICNIKLLDDALRMAVNRAGDQELAPVRHFDELLARVAGILPELFAVGGQELAAVRPLSLALVISERFSLGFQYEESDMLTVTQQFEFSAAHRLHCTQLSDQQNRSIFGKCNNPNGHGHNYVVEVTASIPAGVESDDWELAEFEGTIKRTVIDRFDHRHLNEDVAEFKELNPSVENIADVCFRLLESELEPLRLVNVRVYETPKTWADRRA